MPQKRVDLLHAVFVIRLNKREVHINMIGIIDRFEGDYAVVEFEGRQMKDILRSDLPIGLKEGDAIRGTNGVYAFDAQETERIKKETKAMFDKLWE